MELTEKQKEIIDRVDRKRKMTATVCLDRDVFYEFKKKCKGVPYSRVVQELMILFNDGTT